MKTQKSLRSSAFSSALLCVSKYIIPIPTDLTLNMLNQDQNYSLTEADKTELNKLVTLLELSTGTTIIYSITPEISPQHIVVKTLEESLKTTEEKFKPYNFYYSENSFHNFLYSLDDNKQQNTQTERKLVMAFGIDQLPTPRLVKEMKQLNLGREELFGRNLVLILWINKNQFLDEFRQRAPDFWDWREKVVEFETRNPLIYPYLEWLIAENSYLKMSGVMQVNRQVDIFLDQVYVSLQAQWRQHITETSDISTTKFKSISISPSRSSKLDEMGIADDWDEPYYYEPIPEDSSTKTVTRKIALSQAVRENPYSVILGAPGAGKTTLLRYLALHFAKSKRENWETVIVGEDKEELGKTLLPVFFRIADFAELLKEQPDLTLLEYLRKFYRHWESHFQADEEQEVAEFLLLRMRQGQCLMLLDGLDEVFDQESRREIVKCINQFVDEFPHNKFVITSRIAGYRDVQLSGRFAEFTIEDMDSEQVELFLSRWCYTVEKAQQPDASEDQWESRGNEQVRDILEAVEDNEGVKRLTTNPLLLTILALIHRNGDRLPNRRVKLYELAVQTLTEDWQLSKKLPDAPKVVLKETEVVELLAPLAFWMHEEKPSGVVSQEEVEKNLAEKLAELNDDESDSESVVEAVGEFLRKVRETTGLFVERTPGCYGFMHLTFEEYFTARYIADNDQSDILQLIKNHLHEPRWEEPILLALGYYGVHFPRQVKKLVEKLFKNLEDYQPNLKYGDIKIKNYSSENPIIIYLKAEDESGNNYQEVEFKLKDLLFAGQVISEVEVNSNSRKSLIRKLIITCIGIDTDDFEDDTTKKLLRLLRKIEQFYQKSEVIGLLKEFANDLKLSEENRIVAKTAILYVACYDSVILLDSVTGFVNELEPLLFCSIRDLVQEMGDEMTPALEIIRNNCKPDEGCQAALNFLTAMSYVRENKYDKAIEIFEKINENLDSRLKPFSCWILANCYEEKENYEKANDYYNQSKIADYYQQNTLFIFWRDWGWCQKLNKKYEQSIDYYHKAWDIAKELQNYRYEANIFYNIGNLYQDRGKYEQAINYHQQSKDIYIQLGLDENVADQWYWLADCYHLWGKYEEAIESQYKDLEIRHQLNDQVNIADAYYQLGRIYTDWGKYQQAVNYYQQSKDIYQQLGLDKSVANQWYWLADCYRLWGKYEEAIESQYQFLSILQQLDDQAGIALAYYQLGSIYDNWDKDEQAVDYFQQSKDIFQQLSLDKNVAYLWSSLGDCYYNSKDYKKAIEHYQKSLAINQQLGQYESVARLYSQLAYSQILLAKNTSNQTEISDLLTQGEQNINQAIKINTTSEYKENLAYDYIVFSLFYSERLRLIPNKSSQQAEITLFEEYYQKGFTHFEELGQIVNKSGEALDIARAYLEVEALENLDKSEEIAKESLQVFEDYNRRKLEATARKLLGEIYQKRNQQNQPNTELTATQYLSESLHIYQDLDLQDKAVEVEEILYSN